MGNSQSELQDPPTIQATTISLPATEELQLSVVDDFNKKYKIKDKITQKLWVVSNREENSSEVAEPFLLQIYISGNGLSDNKFLNIIHLRYYLQRRLQQCEKSGLLCPIMVFKCSNIPFSNENTEPGYGVLYPYHEFYSLSNMLNALHQINVHFHPDDLRRLMLSVLYILSTLHSIGVVYGDLSTGNILVEREHVFLAPVTLSCLNLNHIEMVDNVPTLCNSDTPFFKKDIVDFKQIFTNILMSIMAFHDIWSNDSFQEMLDKVHYDVDQEEVQSAYELWYLIANKAQQQTQPTPRKPSLKMYGDDPLQKFLQPDI